jgi:hypothetical protein
MPKVTFEFNLPEENAEFETFSQAGKMHSALWEITQKFRSIEKWGDEGAQTLRVEKVREIIYEILNEEGIEL